MEKALGSVLYHMNGGPNASESLQTTISVTPPPPPVHEAILTLKAGTPDPSQTNTFRTRKADAESIIKLSNRYTTATQRSLVCVVIGNVSTSEIYLDKYAAEKDWTCFIVDYVDNSVARGVLVLSPIWYCDLYALGVPCEVLGLDCYD